MAPLLATNQVQSPPKGCARPKTLLALGSDEPPLLVQVAGKDFERLEIFKHDSWAATARYGSTSGQCIVCKFNRHAPIGILPMRWLGRLLARRERYFLKSLAGVRGIPAVFDQVSVNGRVWPNAVAHEFIPGRPLSISNQLRDDFFTHVESLLHVLHERRIAYVDLHKQENVIVGSDGLPYLIDFQVSLQLPKGRLFEPLLGALRDNDLYCVDKHRAIHQHPPKSRAYRSRPYWLQLHRCVGVPLRTLRRKLLVAIGVRRGHGCSSTELAPEVGLRKADSA